MPFASLAPTSLKPSRNNDCASVLDQCKSLVKWPLAAFGCAAVEEHREETRPKGLRREASNLRHRLIKARHSIASTSLATLRLQSSRPYSSRRAGRSTEFHVPAAPLLSGNLDKLIPITYRKRESFRYLLEKQCYSAIRNESHALRSVPQATNDFVGGHTGEVEFHLQQMLRGSTKPAKGHVRRRQSRPDSIHCEGRFLPGSLAVVPAPCN